VAAVRREPWLAALVAFMSTVMAVFSVVRYTNFAATTDLALFDQAVWHYSRFEAPYSTIKGFDLLGDHFHPAVALLAPLYWLWSDPRMLLIAGAVLVSLSTVPVFLFAKRRLDRPAAYLLAVAYATFFGLQIGAATDFHELELAPLLIALMILFADERRWGWFALVTALTLGVKEDLAPFVACFGIYLLTLRDARRGAVLIAAGVAWYELATRVAIPHFSPEHYTYWSYSELGKDIPSAIWALVKAPWRLVTLTLAPAAKIKTLLYLFAPFLFLSLRSRLIIPALPLLAERFLSTNGEYWTPYFHYNLAIAPVLACSAAAGLANTRPPATRRALALTAAMALVSIAVTVHLTPSPFRQLLRPAFYRAPAFAAAADRAIAQIPSGAPVSADDALLTHLSHRDYANEIAPDRPVEGYLIADLGAPVGQPIGNADFAELGSVVTADLARMTPVFYDDGWLVAKLPPLGRAPGSGVIAPLPEPLAHRLAVLSYAWGTRLQTARHDDARAQDALLAALSQAASAARGPCAALAAQTATAVRQIAVPASPAQIATDIDKGDLLGRLQRFLVLCSPRGRSLLASAAA
jgi:uncharacterized membrane protein